MNGRILVGDHDGVYVIRFEGDVRVTLCGSFDHYLDVMLQDPHLVSVMVDLTQAVAIDSTSLGVLAKLSIGLQKACQQLPMLVCDVPDILRILDNMGFDDVFSIVDENYAASQQLAELPQAQDLNEAEMRQKVIQAHQVLMGLNERNAETFKDLVCALEAEEQAVSSRLTGS